MNDHIFLCMSRANQAYVGGSTLQVFPNMQEADAHIRAWLEQSCGLDCYRGAEQEEKLRSENQGELPEFSFLCPELKTAADLEKYNGYYYYDSLGAIQMFVMAIYDEKTATRFRKEMVKEFQLDKIFSEEADEMIGHLDCLEQSFREPVDYQTALNKVDQMIQNEGLSLF